MGAKMGSKLVVHTVAAAQCFPGRCFVWLSVYVLVFVLCTFCLANNIYSPTLFTVFIEPLAQAISEDPEINGISIKDVKYKINLFADNVLLTLKNPERSIPKVMSLLRMFNWYLGYKLNTHKSQIICYNFIPNSDLQSRFDFKWDSPALKCLGVWIPKNVTKINECDYGPVIRTVKADLDRWTILPLDLSNRIETIKMNVLPWLFYLFQLLSVEVPRKDFREWNKIISRFIWNSKRPSIKYKTLQLNKDEGGLSLPCVEDYFTAAQLRSLVCWCNPDYSAKWKDLELIQFESPAQSILGNCRHWNLYMDKPNQWTRVTLSVWMKTC